MVTAKRWLLCILLKLFVTFCWTSPAISSTSVVLFPIEESGGFVPISEHPNHKNDKDQILSLDSSKQKNEKKSKHYFSRAIGNTWNPLANSWKKLQDSVGGSTNSLSNRDSIFPGDNTDYNTDNDSGLIHSAVSSDHHVRSKDFDVGGYDNYYGHGNGWNQGHGHGNGWNQNQGHGHGHGWNKGHGQGWHNKGHGHGGAYHYQIYPSNAGWGWKDYYNDFFDDYKGLHELGGLSGLFGLFGLKGLAGIGWVGIIKIGLLLVMLLPIFGPLILGALFLIFLPLLLLPIPVVTIPTTTAGRNLDSYTASAREFLSDQVFDDGHRCIERISCEISAKMMSNSTALPGSIKMNMRKIVEKLATRNNTLAKEIDSRLFYRISRGVHEGTFAHSENDNLDKNLRTESPKNISHCLVFACSRLDDLQKIIISAKQLFKK